MQINTYRFPAGLTQALTFAFVSDLHEADWRPVLAGIDAASPDAVLVGGDFVHNAEHYRRGIAFIRAAAAKYPTFCSLGNHELRLQGRIPALLEGSGAVLLDNAFKYCRSGGEVSLQLRQEGRHLVLEVYNTGPGIAPEDLPHIFERFYRCDKARTGNGSYGLGLAIARAAVEAAGGKISVESEYGHWSRFRVTLPERNF